jgi:site-specific recombinase XerD
VVVLKRNGEDFTDGVPADEEPEQNSYAYNENGSRGSLTYGNGNYTEYDFSSTQGISKHSRTSYRKSYFLPKVPIRRDWSMMGDDHAEAAVAVVDCWGSAPDPEVLRLWANGTYRVGDTLFTGDVARAVWQLPGARGAPQQSPIPQEDDVSLYGLICCCNEKLCFVRRIPMRQWDSVVDQYMKEYSSRGLAESSVKAVRSELDKWGMWMKRRRPKPQLETITSDLLIHYISARCAFKSKSRESSVISVMRCMGEFLVREGYWMKNPFRWIRGPKINHRARVPRRISKRDMMRLWQAAATNRQGYQRSLWLAVLAILYGVGIRRSELTRLNISHWNREQGTLLVDGRKTGWERQVVLPDVSRQCLEHYLAQRHNRLEMVGRVEEQALFVSSSGYRLKGTQVSGAIRRIAKRAGLKGITIHQFRHTCASDLLEAGLHVAQVQEILGHQAIGTTARYLHISDPQRAEAVKLHPINDILAGREV